ncbi:hypothetical protein RhiirC2_810085 [Rhizophagus irregularis]|uniref:Uncharacterized protein n=1 Tax=Rhizophagus irregularis TaxID=588596 RepID=A0A2N1NTY4_9GLOM|nr:hypothetical protein RhiirC2_810085 [Rhizophagus irregularis]
MNGRDIFLLLLFISAVAFHEMLFRNILTKDMLQSVFSGNAVFRVSLDVGLAFFFFDVEYQDTRKFHKKNCFDFFILTNNTKCSFFFFFKCFFRHGIPTVISSDFFRNVRTRDHFSFEDPRESLLFTENKDFTWILTPKTLPINALFINYYRAPLYDVDDL